MQIHPSIELVDQISSENLSWKIKANKIIPWTFAALPATQKVEVEGVILADHVGNNDTKR